MPQAIPARRAPSSGAHYEFALVLAGMLALAIAFAFAIPSSMNANSGFESEASISLFGP